MNARTFSVADAFQFIKNLGFVEPVAAYGGRIVSKDNRVVKVRLQGDPELVEKLRVLLLEHHEELVLGAPRKGTNPKYAANQQYASYGNFKFDTRRRRRS